MYDVQTNLIKNRLYITWGGLNNADIVAYVNEIESACKYLAPGFTCLIVLNKKETIKQSDNDLLCNTVDLIYAYGVSKIVYVRENNNNSGFFQRSLRDFQTDSTVENAKNIQGAEDILDESKSGN